MKDYITKLQNKPAHVRERAMYLYSLLILFLIVIVWVGHMGREFGNGKIGKEVVIDTTKEETVSPWQALSENVKGVFKGGVASVGSYKNEIQITNENKDLPVVDLEVLNN